MTLLSITTTAHNEEKSIEYFIGLVHKAMLSLPQYDYEIVICDDGSTDNTLSVIKEKHKEDSRVKCVSLSRNFGHQHGLFAALEHSKGDVVITLDSDGQHPPKYIPELINLWEQGYKVVNTRKNRTNINPLRYIADNLFYKIMYYFTNLELGQADFRLIDRTVVDYLLKFTEKEKFIRGLIQWQGFKEIKFNYDVEKRKHDKSKYTILKSLGFAIQGITSFSVSPLDILGKVGIAQFVFVNILPIIVGVLSIFGYLSGIFTWVNVFIYFICYISSLNLLGLSIVGKYIAKIYLEVQNRPTYISKEKIGL